MAAGFNSKRAVNALVVKANGLVYDIFIAPAESVMMSAQLIFYKILQTA